MVATQSMLACLAHRTRAAGLPEASLPCGSLVLPALDTSLLKKGCQLHHLNLTPVRVYTNIKGCHGNTLKVVMATPLTPLGCCF